MCSHTGVKAGQLYRVMRAAVQLGFFTASTGQGSSGQPRFRNNTMSAVLREDHPNSMKHMVHKPASRAGPCMLCNS